MVPSATAPARARDRVFVCYAYTEAEEKPCAEKIARNLATQAYRRPATDADVQRLMGFYATGRKDIGSFIGGVQEVVMAVISSPEFLYRTIQPKERQQASAAVDRAGTGFATELLPVERCAG